MRKYLLAIAACLTAAFVFTACSNDDEPVQETLVKKSFAAVVEREGKSPYDVTMSFLDETNVVVRTTTYISLPNGKTMTPIMDNIGTYTAKDGEGNIHVTKNVIKDDNSSMSFEADADWTFTYDLQTGKLVFDGMVMKQTAFVPMELENQTPPVTTLGSLPTLDDLQGKWLGMGTSSKGIVPCTLDVNGNQVSVTLGNSVNKSFSGTAICNYGTLTFGNCKIEFSAMDNDRCIKIARIYEDDILLASILNIVKQ